MKRQIVVSLIFIATLVAGCGGGVAPAPPVQQPASAQTPTPNQAPAPTATPEPPKSPPAVQEGPVEFVTWAEYPSEVEATVKMVGNSKTKVKCTIYMLSSTLEALKSQKSSDDPTLTTCVLQAVKGEEAPR
jgi:hypothetical protein